MILDQLRKAKAMVKALIAGTIAGATAGALGGFMLGRSRRSLGGLLNGNEAILNARQHNVVRTLMAHGCTHMFKHWPPPGVRDAEKHALLAAAERHLASTSADLEPLRLSVLPPPYVSAAWQLPTPTNPHSLCAAGNATAVV